MSNDPDLDSYYPVQKVLPSNLFDGTCDLFDGMWHKCCSYPSKVIFSKKGEL